MTKVLTAALAAVFSGGPEQLKRSPDLASRLQPFLSKRDHGGVMKSSLQKLNVAAALGVSILLTGCGGMSKSDGVYRTARMPSQTTQQNPPDTSLPPVTGPSVPQPSNPPQSFIPAVTEYFDITGAGGANPRFTSIPVQTDNMLRVKIIAEPGLAVGSVPGTGYVNYTANYGCVSYNITVLGQTVQTPMLSPSGGNMICPNARKEHILDFSHRLAPGSSQVTVQVSAARYDIYCQYVFMGLISPAFYNNYCPAYPVYQTHRVAGTLEIQTNGSSFNN